MTAEVDDPVPGDWDALVDRPPGRAPNVNASKTGGGNDRPPVLSVMASAWADLVSMLAVCTGALVAILAIGERPALPAFSWAAALALVWWAFAAAVLVVVRQATPGMLLAGVSFADPVAPQRVIWVLAAGILGVATLGVSAAIGGENSILCAAASSRVVDGAA